MERNGGEGRGSRGGFKYFLMGIHVTAPRRYSTSSFLYQVRSVSG